jgi:hypothetical protein
MQSSQLYLETVHQAEMLGIPFPASQASIQNLENLTVVHPTLPQGIEHFRRMLPGPGDEEPMETLGAFGGVHQVVPGMASHTGIGGKAQEPDMQRLIKLGPLLEVEVESHLGFVEGGAFRIAEGIHQES